MTADNKQINKQWRLKARPIGAPSADTWEYTETDLPTISVSTAKRHSLLL